MSEKELYQPMVSWFQKYLEDKYKNSDGWFVRVIDTSYIKFSDVASYYEINLPEANGIQVKIDIVGFAKKENKVKLFFIEAKTGSLDIRDLGQLWVYCKLFKPDEAYLMTDGDFGQLNNVLIVSGRYDLLEYGNDEQSRKMNIAIWDKSKNAPDFLTMIPAKTIG